jgi:hypothetical protein
VNQPLSFNPIHKKQPKLVMLSTIPGKIIPVLGLYRFTLGSKSKYFLAAFLGPVPAFPPPFDNIFQL